MKKLSAQQGFVANPLLIGVAVVVGIIVLLVATGTFKFSGYMRVDDSKKSQGEGSLPQTVTSPIEAPKSTVKLNSESYSNSKYGYSISYPEGWKVKEQENNVNMFKPSATKGPDQADVLVTVVGGDLGENKEMKLATIADLHKAYLKKQFGNAEIVGEKEVKVNGQDGYELEFTGSINTEKMHGVYIVMKGEKYLFALIGIANSELWDGEKGTIDASIQTFKLQ